jgi:hopene-associated glycosyltransferase HpnB
VWNLLVTLLPTTLGVMAAIIWTWLALARGFFWRVSGDNEETRFTAEFAEEAPRAQGGAEPSPRKVNPSPQPFPGRVVAVVPARNEADVIGTVIPSLLVQRLATCATAERIAMPVILVDDKSTDGTADAAWRAAESAVQSSELSVIAGAPLPVGWSGKLWAVHQGIERARHLQAEWLLLTDADVVHGPETVAKLAAIARRGDYDLVSFMVKLHCASLAERLLIPAFVYFFFLLYPPAWIRDPRRSTAGAAGGCMLVRLESLDRAGGIGGMRGALIDDCTLARMLKQHGGRVWLGLSEESHSLRRYDTFGDVERMISRTAFHQLRHSLWLLLGTIVGMALTFLAPPALLLTGARLPMILGAAAWAAMTLTYLPMVRFYGLNPAWALTLPAASLFYLVATIDSAVKYWTGRGGEWKGRVQDGAKRDCSE